MFCYYVEFKGSFKRNQFFNRVRLPKPFKQKTNSHNKSSLIFFSLSVESVWLYARDVKPHACFSVHSRNCYCWAILYTGTGRLHCRSCYIQASGGLPQKVIWTSVIPIPTSINKLSILRRKSEPFHASVA